MSDYATRLEQGILKKLADETDIRGEQLCINRTMPDNDVHWTRGYLAACRDLGIFIQKELKPKLNEE